MGLSFIGPTKALVDEAISLEMKRIRTEDNSGSSTVAGMEYALMAGGKRLRPILCLLGSQLTDIPSEMVMNTAIALEFIHTYSLVHDDLPALDNDDLRRGMPTCHIAFGEGEAILIGDALLTHGIGLLLKPVSGLSPSSQMVVAKMILDSIGIAGMIGGQAADLLQEQKPQGGAERLLYIHRHKTGRLLEASIVAGGMLGGLDPKGGLPLLRRFGEAYGLAFQITDDVLDLTSTDEELGKPVGSDLRNDKLTYPKVYGLEKSKEMAREQVKVCTDIAGALGGIVGSRLREMAIALMDRRN